MNLLMQAPLLDSRGNLRYFIGAQIDVSGLVKDATDLDAFQRMLAEEEGTAPAEEAKDEFQELSEMFNHGELDTVRKFGGNMHRDHLEDNDDKASIIQRPRLLIQDQSTFDVESAEKPPPKPEGRLSGPYKHVSCTFPSRKYFILTNSSTCSSDPPLPFAFSSHPPHFVSPASCNRNSSTASVARTACANPYAMRWLTGLAASQPRFAGCHMRSMTSKTHTKKAGLAGYTAHHCWARAAAWEYG